VTLAGVGMYQLASKSSFSLLTVTFSPTVAEALICIGLFILIPVLQTSHVERALTPFRSLTSYFSNISYSLYLFHYPILVVLDQFFPRAESITATSIGYFLVRCGIVLALVHVLYLCFEAQTPKIRKALRNRFIDARLPERRSLGD
jgi:peptidoglycan/LPS O-acetylase OafA/YrhL